jgi:hypothetical protein
MHTTPPTAHSFIPMWLEPTLCTCSTFAHPAFSVLCFGVCISGPIPTRVLTQMEHLLSLLSQSSPALARAHTHRASQVTILVIGQVMLYYTMKWLLRQVCALAACCIFLDHCLCAVLKHVHLSNVRVSASSLPTCPLRVVTKQRSGFRTRPLNASLVSPPCLTAPDEALERIACIPTVPHCSGLLCCRCNHLIWLRSLHVRAYACVRSHSPLSPNVVKHVLFARRCVSLRATGLCFSDLACAFEDSCSFTTL